MRALRFLIMLFCVVTLLAPDAADAARGRARRANPNVGLRDPRYAALIMNPKTGEVYHQHNADVKRYPASLTKMMTLYLLFEALEQDKISMGTRMAVSDYATTQPQTNISLTTLDKIPVETAIKALVVRSANDVAVVVAEKLGGSVPNFATLMTRKARQLGMRNTVFKNPHGLPDGRQYTTARDMAKLGIALKRDFPKYYQYFSTRQFSWNGVTYYTHNRVMLRYSGTDGIKTGFIGASGFNVVSSTERGGRPLLGVVMGGTTATWRDDRMIQLLDSAYVTIAKRGNARGQMVAKNLPAVNGRDMVAQAATRPPPIVQKQVVVVGAPNARAAAAQAAVAPATMVPEIVVSAPVQLIEPAPSATVVVVQPPAAGNGQPRIISVPNIQPAAPAPAPNTLDAQLAALHSRGQSAQDAGLNGMWGIQVGAFSSKQLAERAALQAYQLAQDSLHGSRISVLGSGGTSAAVHRARLENISETQAKKACATLISNNSPCFIFRASSSL